MMALNFVMTGIINTILLLFVVIRWNQLLITVTHLLGTALIDKEMQEISLINVLGLLLAVTLEHYM